jgi:hypothetical protein
MSDSFDEHARKRLAAVMAKRSTQYRWFWDNWDWFNHELKINGKPDWVSIAAEMADMGLTSARGGPPTASGTRQTYTRIKDTKALSAYPKQRDTQETLSPRVPAADMDPGPSFLRTQKPPRG